MLNLLLLKDNIPRRHSQNHSPQNRNHINLLIIPENTHSISNDRTRHQRHGRNSGISAPHDTISKQVIGDHDQPAK